MNAGLWGLTIGGEEMHGSRAPLPEEAWQWTRGAGPGRTGTCRLQVDFERGIPVALDGRRLDPVELIEKLNREAGALGAGRGYHLGDTVLGFKGRIAFEAPAAEVLLGAHRELEKLVLTEDQRFWKDHLGDVYGRRLHQGLFHDPLQRDIEALFASSQERVTGRAHVLLSGGAVSIEGVESPHSLMAASDAKYGEAVAKGADRNTGLGLARALAEPGRLHRRARLPQQEPVQ
jgi:argininosuccinate synthase